MNLTKTEQLELFDQIDTDGDEEITGEEFKIFLKDIWKDPRYDLSKCFDCINVFRPYIMQLHCVGAYGYNPIKKSEFISGFKNLKPLLPKMPITTIIMLNIIYYGCI